MYPFLLKNCPPDFFLSTISAVNGRYPALFGKADNEAGDKQGNGRTATELFIENFGWISNAKMVAEHEAVPLESVWDLGVLHFLNDLLYIKMKADYDAARYNEQSKGKY